jgi:hypothetical protein
VDHPAPGELWGGTELHITSAPGGPPVQLTVAEIIGSADTFRWRVVAPGSAATIDLPDPASIPELEGPRGTVTLTVHRAQIDAFDYASLGYRHLRPASWTAYATDTSTALVP